MPSDKTNPPNTPADRSARRQKRGRVDCRWLLALLLVWFCASGAACPRVLQQYTNPLGQALPPNPTLVQITDVVNDNSARVRSISCSRATLSTPGMPSLAANIALERPRSFRLVGEKFGPQVDLGSNNELLWFWIRAAQPPALFYCRHDQFAVSSARQIIPVEPEWLTDAFGVVTLNPANHLEGPFPLGKGRLEIRSKPTVPGQGSRVTVVDADSGVVIEQHVYDTQGQRLATAMLSKHVRDPASGATLPRHIEIQWPPAKFEFTIDMPDIQVNQLTGQAALFAKPSYSGYNEVDLAQPGQLTPPNPAVQSRAAASARY